MSVRSYTYSLPHHARDFLKQSGSNATLSASFIWTNKNSIRGEKNPDI